ncbi:hypothetical protein MIMGU_mgv11b024103mg, partial [Erythranthe guttata]
AFDVSSNNHLIYINTAAQTPVKLTSTNYEYWHTQWYSLLCGYIFLKFVETKTTPILLQNEYWFCQDQLIRSALITSLSTDLIPFVVEAKISYDVWHTLADTYAKPSRTWIMSLRESLSTMKKGSMLITEFHQNIKQICGQLSAVGVHISMDKISNISFQELHEKLTDFELYLSREINNGSSPIMANFAAKPSSPTYRHSCGYKSPNGSFIFKKNHAYKPHPARFPSSPG